MNWMKFASFGNHFEIICRKGGDLIISVRKEFRSKLEHVLVQFWKHHLQYFRKQRKNYYQNQL
jgi:hypothetical protein